MKKLFQWVMVATLICGASVLTSCSDNSDNPVNPNPSEKTMPRVSKIYMEGHIVLKRKVMGNWMTLTDKTDERALEHEFYWTGNRLDSVKNLYTNIIWDLEYDAQGRLAHEATRLGSSDCTFEYDSKGRLSKTIESVRADEEGHYDKTVTDYIYDGDKLKKTVEHIYVYSQEGVGTKESEYTWDGDNVVSITINETDADGTVNEPRTIIAEYSTNLNPFRGFIHFQQNHLALSIMDEMWAWSKNVPSMIKTSEKNHNDYECKTTGDRVTSFQSHTLAEGETIFTESTHNFDIEYLD